MSKYTLSQPLVCPHCDNRAPMYQICKGEYNKTLVDLDEFGQEEYLRKLEVLVCTSCEEVIFIQHSGFTFEEYADSFDKDGNENWVQPYKSQILFPIQKRNFNHLPDNVAKSYKIAMRLLRIEPIAFAVFAGRTLEFVCKDKGAEGKDLQAKINDLAKKEVIPEILREMAHNLRFFRNFGAHASEIDISAEDAEQLKELCETLLEYVYEMQPMLLKVQQRLKDIQDMKK